jgi:hypothetical protein
MLSPVLFITLVGAICCDPAATRHPNLALALYLATQLGFGAYRTYAAVAVAYSRQAGPPSFFTAFIMQRHIRSMFATGDCMRRIAA